MKAKQIILLILFLIITFSYGFFTSMIGSKCSKPIPDSSELTECIEKCQEECLEETSNIY